MHFEARLFSSLVLFTVAVPLGIFSSVPTWNVTCPSQCRCSNSLSEHLMKRQLRTVDCSHRNLTSVPQVPLNTESLILRNNRISDLLDTIPELSQLRVLDVSVNKLSNLGRGHIFRNLTVLSYLNLSKNKLNTIYKDVFRGLIKLEVFSLADNYLSLIESAAFRFLGKLKSLDLSSNQLNGIYVEWFSSMSQLVELNVANNRIHQINSAVLRPLKKVEKIYLNRNRISDIGDDSFEGLINVQLLNLAENQLNVVPSSALRFLNNLKTLYLSANPITRIKTDDLSNLPVQELHLNQLPQLVVVDESAFSNLTYLTTLQLHNNHKLIYIHPKSFNKVPRLKDIYLHDNNLQVFPRSVAQSFPPGVAVSLFGNPFRCDCNIRWLKQEIASNNSKLIFTELSHLKCAYPDKLAGKLIKDLDFKKIPKACPASVLSTLNGTIERKLGESLSFDCRAIGIPEPTISWNIPGGVWLNQSLNNVRYQLKPAGTLKFFHLKEEDAGIYTCVAENPLGTSQVKVGLRVRRVDIHLFPVVVASTFVALVWNGTARNSLPKYTLMYKAEREDKKHIRYLNVSPLPKSYTIHDLQPETIYEFCISFKDQDGRYVRLDCTSVRTQDAEYMKQGIQRTSNIAVAIVLGIVAAMLIVICMVTMAARKYRHNEYENPDKPPLMTSSMSQIPLDNLYSPLMSNVGS